MLLHPVSIEIAEPFANCTPFPSYIYSSPTLRRSYFAGDRQMPGSHLWTLLTVHAMYVASTVKKGGCTSKTHTPSAAAGLMAAVSFVPPSTSPSTPPVPSISSTPSNPPQATFYSCWCKSQSMTCNMEGSTSVQCPRLLLYTVTFSIQHTWWKKGSYLLHRGFMTLAQHLPMLRRVCKSHSKRYKDSHTSSLVFKAILVYILDFFEQDYYLRCVHYLFYYLDC